jgi:hypothetical protein
VSTINGNRNLRLFARRGAAIIFVAAGVASATAQTQPPYALFQYSTLTGTGNTINATYLPVVTSSGTSYINLTLQFDVDNSGNVTVSSGYPQLVQPPTPVLSSFIAGTYALPDQIYGGGLITVEVPAIGPGGTAVWSLHTSPDAFGGANGCTFPSMATWYVGSIDNNPYAARLKKVGLTSGFWSYGVMNGPACNLKVIVDGAWLTESIIGLSQIGNTLMITSFTNKGTDFNTPQDQVTFLLQPPKQ